MHVTPDGKSICFEIRVWCDEKNNRMCISTSDHHVTLLKNNHPITHIPNPEPGEEPDHIWSFFAGLLKAVGKPYPELMEVEDEFEIKVQE